MTSINHAVATKDDEGHTAEIPRLLLVDDNEMVRLTLAKILEGGGFNVATAQSVNEALKLIGSQPFDALLSDLHMPGAGDGLTVVSAMRHFNPKAVTIIFSGFPEMKEAAAAILLQADEILVKPMSPDVLIQTIKDRLKAGANAVGRVTQTVAFLLEEDTQITIDDWLLRVNLEPDVITVRLSTEKRCAHLPHLFRDLITRLRKPLPLGTRALPSAAAVAHGLARREQGYTAAMIVEESRMLQVSIFQTLQNNLHRVDFSLLLLAVMAIADEVDSQLAQTMASYIAEAKVDLLPVVA
ncbi:response regulator [Granulicella tundricola]|uniref:Response regulator receiver protein n=1 Tax=Granulicella tundricola (strain ATCC BAA-1859 / DSM 23138 / MP5ACTX9) TaxID=1198114 RepID=E8WVR0_GRATM|nr:response regulator [Granulicella tundricola]ADW69589.1 response regulator receiver protein [Granulicella tundricola MP5ACTX9]